MKRVHLIFGLMLFVVFLTTGQFMRADFPDKEAIDQGFRLLMRSRHIYILFSALLHIGLGIYLTPSGHRRQKIMQNIGSVTLIISGPVLVAAFIGETYFFGRFSDLSRYGIYTSLAGVGMHLLSALGKRTAR